MIPYLFPDPIAGEPSWSRVDRAAALNCKENTSLLFHSMGIDQYKFMLGRAEAVSRAATLFDTTVADVLSCTPVYAENKLWTLGNEKIDSHMIAREASRYCPQCVAGSHNASRSLTLYLHPITVCPVHSVPFLDELNDDTGSIKVSSEASRYLTARLGITVENVSLAPLLDGLDWHTCAKLLFRIGHVLVSGETKASGEKPYNEAMEAGFEATRTEANLRTALDVLKERAPAAKEIGLNRLYGPSIMLSFKPETPSDMKEVAAIFADHALDHLPFRDESIMAGHTPRVRTVTAGAKELDIHPKTLAQVLPAYGQADYFTRHKLISGPVFDVLEARLADTMPQHEMFERFGLTALPGKAIVAAGILAPVYPRHRHKRLYSALDIIGVIDDLSLEAEIVEVAPSGLLSIPDAAASVRRSVLSVFEALMEERLEVKARLAEPRFDNLFISPVELRACFFGEETREVVLQRTASRLLRTTEKVLKNLIAENRIEAITEVNPIPRKTRTIVTMSGLQAFHAKYILSGEIVRRSDLGFKHVKPTMAERGLTPIETKAAVTMFARASVEPFLDGEFAALEMPVEESGS